MPAPATTVISGTNGIAQRSTNSTPFRERNGHDQFDFAAFLLGISDFRSANLPISDCALAGVLLALRP